MFAEKLVGSLHKTAIAAAGALAALGGALYAHKSGSMMGRIQVRLPAGHTWRSFAELLLETMPPASSEHYEAKIAVFLRWYQEHGVLQIPDDECEEMRERFPRKGGPSWKRICITLLKNDWWCKGLSFSQTKSAAYEKYLAVMKARRRMWGL